jgi:membrane peptidoglycan carboxypeptidase
LPRRPSGPVARAAKRALIVLAIAAGIATVAIVLAAHRRTRAVARDAERFEATGLSEREVPAEWKRILLAVEDPGFYRHHGVDVWTPGAGWTTITQALAKRYYFERFRAGVFRKLVQTIDAIVLDSELSKKKQLTLIFNVASFGPGPAGWVEGFPAAAREFFGKPFPALTRSEYVSLVAMLVAPSDLSPTAHPDDLAERAGRIERLVRRECAPRGFRDVMLEGCRLVRAPNR